MLNETADAADTSTTLDLVRVVDGPFPQLAPSDARHPVISDAEAQSSIQAISDIVNQLASLPEQSLDSDDKLVTQIHTLRTQDEDVLFRAVTDVLHSDDIAGADAAWRGVEHGLNQANSDDAYYRLLPAIGLELEQLIGGKMPLDSTTLFAKLIKPFNYVQGEAPTCKIFIDHAIAITSKRDITLLNRLADLGQQESIGFSLGVNPLSLGVESLADLVDMPLDQVRRKLGLDPNAPQPALAAYEAFRQRHESRHVNLVVSPFLGRPLHGAMDAAKGLPKYREPVDRPVWVRGIYFIAGNMISAQTKHDSSTFSVGPMSGGQVDGLPVILQGDPAQNPGKNAVERPPAP